MWQSYTLLWLCGLCSVRWLAAACLCAALVYLADARLWNPLRGGLGLLVLAAGWSAAQIALPQSVPPPAWLNEQSPPRLCATVDSVQTLPQGRLRVLLRDVHPLAATQPPHTNGTAAPHSGTDTAPPADVKNKATPDMSHLCDSRPSLPHNVAWTWDAPTFTPLSGQKIALSLPLRPVDGFANDGMSDSAYWWRSKDVFWRTWSRGDKGQPTRLATASDWGTRQRAAAREALLRALRYGSGTTPPTAATAAQPATAADAPPHVPATVSPLTQGQAFLPALLFGDRSALTHTTIQRMAQASLVHSLALSGQHLALASLVGVGLAWLLGLCAPAAYLCMPRLKWALLLSLAPALVYVWLGGAPASLWRAYAMLLLLTLLLWRDTALTTLDILCGALLAITVAHPLAVFDVGLQMSALCVAALGLCLPLVRALPAPAPYAPHRRWWRALRFVVQIGITSLCIQLALLPVSLLLFHTASPYFMFNMLWLPILGMWVMPLGALGAACALVPWPEPWPALTHGLLWLAVQPCDALLALLQALDTSGWFNLPALLRPHWTSLPAWGALCTALALRRERPSLPPAGRRLLCAGVLLLLMGPALRLWHNTTTPPTLHMLDVGQGQALCLTLPGGQRLLVDGGGNASPTFDTGRDIVSPSLAYNATPHLWGVLCSHPDLDHLRGLGYIARAWQVAHIFHSDDQPRNKRPYLLKIWADLRRNGTLLYAGMRLPLPATNGSEMYMEILHPPRDTTLQGNNRSLIVRVVRSGHGVALLTGDAEKAALRQLLASGQNLQADVLVVPHHGSKSSFLPELYDAVRPRVALVSCGQGNRYGYPSAQVRAALAQRGIPLYTTATHGAITVAFPPQGLSVRTARHSLPQRNPLASAPLTP